MKKIFLAFSIILAAAQSGVAAGKDGSSGTTGGGDYQKVAETLLPSHVEFWQVSPYSGKTDFKLRSHWYGDEYAWYTGSLVVFDRAKFLSGGDVTTCAIEALSENKKISKKLTARQKEDLKLYCNSFFILDKKVEDLRENGRSAESLLSSKNFRLVIDGKEFTLEDYREYFEKLDRDVTRYIDVRNVKSLGLAGVYNKFKMALAPNNVYWGKLNYLGESVIKELDVDTEDFLRLAHRSVSDSGACNEAVYEELQDRLRQWTLGSEAYFKEASILGYLFEDWSKKQVRAKRGEIRELIAQIVDGPCSLGKASVGDSSDDATGEVFVKPTRPVVIEPTN